MSMIPKHIAKIVEWHLKNANCIRANAFAEAEALRAKARDQGQTPEVPIKGKGKPGDPVGRVAQLLAEADRIQRNAPIWAGVVERTRTHFAGQERIGRFYTLYYSIGLDFGYIAQEMHAEKTTLYNWRDRIVTHAALEAVGAGLVKLWENTD